MKKILILIETLSNGGAERVLCDTVKYLDKNKYDITVMYINNLGNYDKQIEQYVKVQSMFPKLKSSENLIGKISNILRLQLRKIICKLPSNLINKYIFKEDYDIQIAFLEDLSTRIIGGITDKRVKKIAWVHTNLSVKNWPINLGYFKNENHQRKIYASFDKVICVSEALKNDFVNKFNLSNVQVQYNPIDKESILIKSKEVVDDLHYDNKKLKLISVGRLCPLKGYDRLLEVHNRLINDGYDYELWILGDGEELESIKKFINKNKLNSTVKLLGFKENPYKYISKADIYVCPSRTEAYSTVVIEAIILNKPIITTNCTGMNEILDNGEYGLITTNDTVGLYNGIKKIIDDKILCNFYAEKAIEKSRFYNIQTRIKEIELIIDSL